MKRCQTIDCTAKAVSSCWECGQDKCAAHSTSSSTRLAGHVCTDNVVCPLSHQDACVWRMNLSPNQADAFALAVKHKVAGMGWRMNDSCPIQPVSWAEYIKG